MAAEQVFVREYLAQIEGNEIVIALIFFCWLVLGRHRHRSGQRPGATLGRLSCLLAIFTFQAPYGYIYLRIGALVTVFLVGMFPGAWIGGRLAGKRCWALMAGDLMLSVLLVLSFLLIQRQSLGSAAGVLYLFRRAAALTAIPRYPVSGHDALPLFCLWIAIG